MGSVEDEVKQLIIDALQLEDITPAESILMPRYLSRDLG